MKKISVAILIALLVNGFPVLAWAQTTPTPTLTAASAALNAGVAKLKEQQAAIADKEKEISDLEKKINDLKGKRDSAAADAEIISAQVQRLADQLQKAQLELKQTQVGITVTVEQKKSTEVEIEDLQHTVANTKEKLKTLLQQMYQQEQTSWVTIFFSNLSLSDVLQDRATYKELQDRTIGVIQELRQKNEELNTKATLLEDQHQQLASLESALAQQQASIDEQKKEQQKFLKAKQDQQIAYQGKIAEVEAARKEIQNQVFSLKNAGVEVSLNNAFDMARFAGKLTGVRPALLLAVLKVESNLGNNVGSGHYPGDMHPASRDAFVRIAKKLNLDSNTAPVSRRPSSGYGWGGAMGPAQIMPATWETIEPRLAQMLHKDVPDPYNLTDAFVATAIFLADRGAANGAQEYEAVNKYIAGPYWQYHTWYGDRVLAVAKEYAAQGL